MFMASGGLINHLERFSGWQVFIINPADKKYMDLLKMAEAFYVHNAPVRWVFVTSFTNAHNYARTQWSLSYVTSQAEAVTS